LQPQGSDSGASTTKEDEEEDLNMDEMMGVQPKQDKSASAQESVPEEEVDIEEPMEEGLYSSSPNVKTSEPIPIRFVSN